MLAKFSHMNVRFNLVTPGNLMFEGFVWESKRLQDELMFQPIYPKIRRPE